LVRGIAPSNVVGIREIGFELDGGVRSFVGFGVWVGLGNGVGLAGRVIEFIKKNCWSVCQRGGEMLKIARRMDKTGMTPGRKQ
jgi:hypothetical protein